MTSILVEVISTYVDETFRKIKARVMGKDDIQTPDQAAPHGIDSNPVAGMTAVYAQTATQGEPVIIGYLNQDQLAAPGEMRIYSTDADGALQTFIWLKDDGTMQLGGDADNAVRYKPLEQTVKAIQDFLNIELPKISTGVAAGGGSYTAGTASFDVSGAKIDEIKTL